jgi:uncharacterized protein
MSENEAELLRPIGWQPVDPWMETLSMGQYQYLAPHPDTINIRDIARSLTYLCRYNGHCTRFYSVAEHCIHMAMFAPPELKLLALLHDAHEAYCGDMTSPMKAAMNSLSHGGGWSVFTEIERLARNATEEALDVVGLWSPEDRNIIKELDVRICGDERSVIKHGSPHDWGLPEPLGIADRIQSFPWRDFDRTEQTFLEIYRYEKSKVGRLC